MEFVDIEKAFDYKMTLTPSEDQVKASIKSLTSSRSFTTILPGMSLSDYSRIKSNPISSTPYFKVDFKNQRIFFQKGLKGGGIPASMHLVRESIKDHNKNNPDHRPCMNLVNRVSEQMQNFNFYSNDLLELSKIHPRLTFHPGDIFKKLFENFEEPIFLNHPLLCLKRLEVFSLLNKYYFFSFLAEDAGFRVDKVFIDGVPEKVKDIKLNLEKNESITDIGVVAELDIFLEMVKSNLKNWWQKLMNKNVKVFKVLLRVGDESNQSAEIMKNFIYKKIKNLKNFPYLQNLIQFYDEIEELVENKKKFFRYILFDKDHKIDDNVFIMVCNLMIRSMRILGNGFLSECAYGIDKQFEDSPTRKKSFIFYFLISLHLNSDADISELINKYIIPDHKISEGELKNISNDAKVTIQKNRIKFSLIIKCANKHLKKTINQQMLINKSKSIDSYEIFELNYVSEIETIFTNMNGNILFIHGEPGVGKSSVAYKYIERYSKNYSSILVFDSYESEELAWQVLNCIRLLNITSENFSRAEEILIDHLNRTDLKILLIFDNLQNKDIINRFILSKMNIKYLLIFSENYRESPNERSLRVRGLDDQISELLIRASLMNFDMSNNEDILNIAHLCKNNPQWIKISISKIVSQSLSLSNYYEFLFNHTITDRFYQSNIDEIISLMGESEKVLVKILSFCDNDNIPKELAKDIFCRIRDPNDWQKAKNFVLMTFLVKENENFFKYDKNVFKNAEKIQIQEIFSHLVNYLKKKIRVKDFYDEASWELVKPFIEHTKKVLKSRNIRNYDFLQLQIRLSQYFLYKEKRQQISFDGIFESLQIYQQNPESPQKLFKIILDIAILKLDQGIYSENCPYFAWCFTNKSYSNNHQKKFTLKYSIFWRNSGNYKNCFESLRIYFDNREPLYSHFNFHNNLACFEAGKYFLEVGNLDQAEFYFNECSKRFEQIFTKENFYYVLVQLYLAICKYNQERFQDSLTLLWSCFEFSRLGLYEFNPELALVPLYLGKIYLVLQDHAMAKAFFNDCKRRLETTVELKDSRMIELLCSQVDFCRITRSYSNIDNLKQRLLEVKEMYPGHVLNARVNESLGDLNLEIIRSTGGQDYSEVFQDYGKSYLVLEALYGLSFFDFNGKNFAFFNKNLAELYYKYAKLYLNLKYLDQFKKYMGDSLESLPKNHDYSFSKLFIYLELSFCVYEEEKINQSDSNVQKLMDHVECCRDHLRIIIKESWHFFSSEESEKLLEILYYLGIKSLYESNLTFFEKCFEICDEIYLYNHLFIFDCVKQVKSNTEDDESSREYFSKSIFNCISQLKNNQINDEVSMKYSRKFSENKEKNGFSNVKKLTNHYYVGKIYLEYFLSSLCINYLIEHINNINNVDNNISEEDFDYHKSKVHKILAKAYEIENDYQQSKVNYLNCLIIRRSLHSYPIKIIKSLTNLADLLFRMNDFSDAAQYYIEIERMYQSEHIDDNSYLKNAYTKLAILYQDSSRIHYMYVDRLNSIP